MNRTELLSLFSKLNVWGSGDQRAPHKPLLILYALGCLARGQTSVPFSEVSEVLTRLLREFGPPRKVHHPEYPFWRLQNDGIWEVTSSGKINLSTDGTATKGELLRTNAEGRFPEALQSALRSDPLATQAIAEQLLNAHFPSSIHDDIADAVGLDLHQEQRAAGGGRDPNFRQRVLICYEHRCAVCDFQLLLSGLPVGLEAAHIKWHQASGPGIVANGICMCALHHRLFDLGAFTIDATMTILLSNEASANTNQGRSLFVHHGQKLRLPVMRSDVPSLEYLSWHRIEVFRGDPRPLSVE